MPPMWGDPLHQLDQGPIQGLALLQNTDRRPDLQGQTMQRKHEKYERLIARCKSLPPARTAVVHPCDESSLRAAIDATKAGLIAPILVGPRARIEALAREHDIDISRIEIVDAPHSEASAAAAVTLVREGKAEALMK